MSLDNIADNHYNYIEVRRMDKVIDFKNVSWKRQGKEILHHINWEIKKGEHWAVLGLNGAGKTTLLNMVNSYIWPSTGEVSVLGHRFGEVDITKLRYSIGWVSSSLGAKLNERHNTEELVVSGKFAAVGLTFADPTEEDFEQARSVMKLLNIEHTYGMPYEKCSHGEKQKVLIARGLISNPKLLILDEPTSGLDFISREELLETIARLAAQKDAPTIIFVTHHVEEVTPTFTHTLLLKEGTIFASGTREEVLTSENMTGLYGKNIDVSWRRERAWTTLV